MTQQTRHEPRRGRPAPRACSLFRGTSPCECDTYRAWAASRLLLPGAGCSAETAKGPGSRQPQGISKPAERAAKAKPWVSRRKLVVRAPCWTQVTQHVRALPDAMLRVTRGWVNPEASGMDRNWVGGGGGLVGRTRESPQPPGNLLVAHLSIGIDNPRHMPPSSCTRVLKAIATSATSQVANAE